MKAPSRLGDEPLSCKSHAAQPLDLVPDCRDQLMITFFSEA